LHLIGDSEENASALVYDLIANDSGGFDASEEFWCVTIKQAQS